MGLSVKKTAVILSVIGLLSVKGAFGMDKNGCGKINVFNSVSGSIELVDKVCKTDKEWQATLTPEQYRVMRNKGTELPSSGVCQLPRGPGIYRCAACGNDLFAAATKFDSGTGWPSFWQSVSDLNIKTVIENNHDSIRVEVLCARCGAHLGHVFDDGPLPTGNRYCINSVALTFIYGVPRILERATFAAGCFWGVEETFRNTPGVLLTHAGYTGGVSAYPTYEDVCSDTTGHAEAVQVDFDPLKVSYRELLNVFFSMHDPTTIDRQGPDVGSQYRSAIFYHTQEQKRLAQAAVADLEKSHAFNNRIATQLIPSSVFYPAEEYHQQYFAKRGIKPVCHIQPKKSK